MKTAAIYARVSSDRQKKEETIKSQIAELLRFAEGEDFVVREEWIFKDEGYSGSLLVRPALEQLRDLAAQGELETLLVYSPDRLSRKHAYQVLLLDEFSRNGVEVIFKNAPRGDSPEELLLRQMQSTAPAVKRKETLRKELARTQKGTNKLLDAYQDSLVTLSELRERIPELRKKVKTIESELQSLEATEFDQDTLNQLQETVDTFQLKMLKNAQELDVKERQKIIRLLVKEILIYEDRITIRHSIPHKNAEKSENVQLCTGCRLAPSA